MPKPMLNMRLFGGDLKSEPKFAGFLTRIVYVRGTCAGQRSPGTARESSSGRTADGQATDHERRLADTDGHPLALLAAIAHAGI